MRRTLLATLLATLALAMAPRTALATETCGNGADDDANSRVDEGCNPYSVTGVCWSPLDCGTTGTVSPRTGNYVWRGEEPDVVITPPSGPELRFHRFYMSQYEPGYSSWTFKSNLGKYWHHSYMSWLIKTTTPSPDEVVLHLPTGEEVWFNETSSSSNWANYTPQSGRDFVRLRQCKTTLCGVVAQYDWELVLLTGETYVYDGSTTGDHTAKLSRMTKYEQSIDLAYDGTTGFLKTVTSASGRKYRLAFEYYQDLLSTVIAQSCDDSGGECDQDTDWVDDKTFLYTYESNQLKEVLRDDDPDVVIAAYTYDGGYLHQVKDTYSGSTEVAVFEFVTGTSGVLANVEFGAYGSVGYSWGDASCDSGNGVVVLFNKKQSTRGDRCLDNDDCDGGYCGGFTDPEEDEDPTGFCYEAKRCVKSTTANGEHLIDGDITASCGSLSAARCLAVKEYTWNTTELRVKGVESPDGVWTSYTHNTNGLVTKMVENDTDDDASTVPSTSGDEGRATWFFYDNSSFPGFLTESRRLSDLKPGGSCDESTTTDCRRERWTHTNSSPNGLVNTYQLSGFTMKNCSTTCAISTLSIVYDWDYDSYARVTVLNGPIDDDIVYTYYDDSGDANTHRYRRVKEVKRKVTATPTYLTTTYSNYDSWGNAKDVAEPSRLVCRSFEPNWGLLATSRVVIDTGSLQTACSDDDTGGPDETTIYSYDNLRRLDLVEKPKGNCVDYSYDTKNRVSTIEELDDASGECASSGNYREFTYDEDGLLIKEEWKDSGGTVKKRQEYTYANDRRMASMVNPENTEVARQWDYRDDGLPSVLKHEDWTSGNAKTEQMGYNDLDQLESHAKYKDGSTADEWIFERSTFLGLPITITDEAGHEIEPQWDDAGRKIKEVTPEANIKIWEYDAGSRVIQYMQDWGGAEQKKDGFTYDLANRRTGWNTADYCGTTANEYQYSYDSASGSACPSGASGDNLNGRLACVKAKMWCDNGAADKTFDQFTVYSYDDAGRIKSTTITDDSGSRTATITYTYDLNGNVTAIGYPADPSSSTLNITYDSAGVSDADRINDMSRDSTLFLDDVTWMPFGPVVAYEPMSTYPTNKDMIVVFDWNLAYRIVSILLKYKDGGSTPTWLGIDYNEDPRGRYTERVFTGGSAQKDMYFLYDDLDRVTCRRDSSGSRPRQWLQGVLRVQYEQRPVLVHDPERRVHDRKDVHADLREWQRQDRLPAPGRQRHRLLEQQRRLHHRHGLGSPGQPQVRRQRRAERLLRRQAQLHLRRAQQPDHGDRQVLSRG